MINDKWDRWRLEHISLLGLASCLVNLSRAIWCNCHLASLASLVFSPRSCRELESNLQSIGHEPNTALQSHSALLNFLMKTIMIALLCVCKPYPYCILVFLFIMFRYVLLWVSPYLVCLPIQVVYVARNPRDVCVSYYHHQSSLSSAEFIGDFPDFADFWCRDLCKTFFFLIDLVVNIVFKLHDKIFWFVVLF